MKSEKAKKPNRLTRRCFLRSSATAVGTALALPTMIPSSLLGANPPSERVALGFIGTGGRGSALLTNFMALKDAHVVAVCDVKQPQRERARQSVDKHYDGKVCEAYNDFRLLCARRDIDAVVVASTDHWHVLHALEAVRAGKDVYCEKPLGMSVEQGQMRVLPPELRHPLLVNQIRKRVFSKYLRHAAAKYHPDHASFAETGVEAGVRVAGAVRQTDRPLHRLDYLPDPDLLRRLG